MSGIGSTPETFDEIERTIIEEPSQVEQEPEATAQAELPIQVTETVTVPCFVCRERSNVTFDIATRAEYFHRDAIQQIEESQEEIRLAIEEARSYRDSCDSPENQEKLRILAAEIVLAHRRLSIAIEQSVQPLSERVSALKADHAAYVREVQCEINGTEFHFND